MDPHDHPAGPRVSKLRAGPPQSNYQGPGTYRHYKGGLYEVVGLGVREASLGTLEEEFDVLYRPVGVSLQEHHDYVLIERSLDNFNEKRVSVRQGTDTTLYVPRFRKVAHGSI